MKFDSLILKKQATKEVQSYMDYSQLLINELSLQESKLRKLIKDTEDQNNEAALLQARADYDGDVGIEKQKQAVRFTATHFLVCPIDSVVMHVDIYVQALGVHSSQEI